MGDSLRNQLIKAGLVSTQRAEKSQTKKQPKLKKSERELHKKSEVHSAIKEQQAQKIAHDKALNAVKEQQIAQKALKAQIRVWVLEHQIPTAEGAQTYYFQHINRAKRVMVTKEQHEQLTKGLLAVTVLDKNTYLLPLEIGKKILENAPQYAVYIASHIASQEEKSAQEDPYAQFQVPDDLQW